MTMKLFRRAPTYSLWQVTSNRADRLTSGLSRKEAERNAREVNGNLALFKMLAPTGPQDARAVVLPDGEAPR